ncbi:hypothetical protein V6N00_07700 [Tersicoccus sp. MR15.9]|uniref:hypothetical protein n=1 Tax=Tersicoccus mangrovi TaxID=3121635 RepID=UPI002FE565A4
MQIRPEDQPDDSTGARRFRGSASPTEPIATSSWDRTQPIDRPGRPRSARGDLDGGEPTQANPTVPLDRSRTSRENADGGNGQDYSNWYDSDLYVGDDEDTATRPIETPRRGRADDPADARTQAIDRQPASTAPQPISSERATWYQDGEDDDDRYPDDADDRAGARNGRQGRDDRRYDVDARDAWASDRDPYRVNIAVKLGLLVLGLVLAVIAAVLLGMNGQAAAGSIRPNTALGPGLLEVLGFGAGLLCVAIVLIAGRTSSTAPLMGSIIGLPALIAMFSGDAAGLVRGQLTSWGVPGPVAEAFVRPETALAGVLLLLIGVAFSTRRRAEDLAGPVSSFFLGLFSTVCFVPGLALFALATQENLLRSFAQAGWPSADVTRPVAIVVGIILMAIGIACTSRASGGMVVSGVLVLVVAVAAGFVFLAASAVLPAGVADLVQRDVTVTAPLVAILAGVALIVASFAGLSLGREREPAARY